MTQESSYSIIERDQHGDVLNIISGLNEASANDLADVLRTGTAYQGEQPQHALEVVREPTPAEQLVAVVDSWLANGDSLTRVDHLVECLRHVADQLETLGDMQIPRTGLKVEMHLFSGGGSNEERTAALDELAAVFGLKGVLNEAKHYHTGHNYGSGVRLVTIVESAPAESKPLVISDETIRQAEWIGKRYPDGVNYVEPCDDCESNGYNCSAHRAGGAS